jgi:tetratricopeptide (TPR) repeat protein
MESNIQPNAPEPTRESGKAKKIRKDRFKWWQSLIILVATLAICLSAGYYISQKYLWNQKDAELTKQLDYNKSLVDQKPNDPSLRVQLGYTYFLKGDNDNAIKQYEVAKNLDKNNYAAYLNLAIVYDKENQTDNTLQAAKKAAKISPQDYKSQLLIGRSYRKLKMYKEATVALQNAYRFKPGNTDIIYEAGLIAEDQGKIKDAEKIYKETLSFDPTFKPAIDALDRLKSKNK